MNSKNIESEDSMMTTQEVVKYLNISRTTLYKIMDAGELRSYKVRNVLRFRREDVEAYLEKNENK